MWLIAVYHQVSLFSLKSSDATSTGGRSLLVPTPFSIKMALLDVALRLYGETEVDNANLFPLIRDLRFALSPPEQVVVNKCFVRIQKPFEDKKGSRNKDENTDAEDSSMLGNSKKKGLFISNVAFREYVQYRGPLGVALEVTDQRDADTLAPLMMQVTYFGKRGSLFQINNPPFVVETLSTRQGYIPINEQQLSDGVRDSRSILQILDDCDSKLTLAKVNIYSKEDINMGKDRVFIPVTLPYQMTRSSRNFTLYERIAAQ